MALKIKTGPQPAASTTGTTIATASLPSDWMSATIAELGPVSTAKASTPPCRDCGVEAGTTAVTVTVKVRTAHHSLCSRCFIRGGYLESEVVR